MFSVICFLGVGIFSGMVSGKTWTAGNKKTILSVDVPPVSGQFDWSNWYNVSMNGVLWLRGAEPGVHCLGNWSNPSAGSLAVKNVSNPEASSLSIVFEGSWGEWEVEFAYDDENDAFLFVQRFLDDCPSSNVSMEPWDAGSSSKSPEDVASTSVLSSFPSFMIDNTSYLGESGYYEWNGRFMHDYAQKGIGLEKFRGGALGGPLLLFEPSKNLGDGMVLAPLDSPTTGQLVKSSGCRFHSKAATCSIGFGYDFFGNDLVQTNTSTPQECCSFCLSHTSCTCFSWAGKEDPNYENMCWLKTSTAGNRSALHYSGVVRCPGDMTPVLNLGTQGYILDVPQGHKESFVLIPSTNAGVRSTMYRYGSYVTSYFNTQRLDPQLDPVAHTLGSWTDNGAVLYCGNPPNTSDIADLFEGYRKSGVIDQIRYLQLDPYWTVMGDENNSGCSQSWTTTPKLFPDGIESVYEAANKVPLLLYENYFCSESGSEPIYANESIEFENSFRYNAGFDKGIIAQASPTDSYRLHTFNFDRYKSVMGGFEIDFSDFDTLLFPSHVSTVDGQRDWFGGMARAAGDMGYSLQICMGLSSLILESAKYSSVTSARSSEDDFPTNGGRWRIAYTALLLDPLQIGPFFDVTWTTAVQPNPYKVAVRSNVELWALIATFSKGPFGIGDAPGYTNATLVQKIASKNGTLLHPLQSMTPVDAMYFPPGSPFSPPNPSSEIWSAPMAGGAHAVLAVDASPGFLLPFSQLYPTPSPSTTFVAFQNPCSDPSNPTACDLKIVNNQSIFLQTPTPNSDNHTFSLTTLSPLNGNLALLGEVGPFVSLSPQRFTDISSSPTKISALVHGAPNETVKVQFYDHSKPDIIQQTIQIASNGAPIPIHYP